MRKEEQQRLQQAREMLHQELTTSSWQECRATKAGSAASLRRHYQERMCS